MSVPQAVQDQLAAAKAKQAEVNAQTAEGAKPPAEGRKPNPDGHVDGGQADASELAKLQHSHAVLQGKYSNELPIAARKLRDAKQEIGRLQQQLNAANAKLAQVPAQKPSAEDASTSYAETLVKEGYGEDETIVRMARDQDRLLAELEQNRQKPPTPDEQQRTQPEMTEADYEFHREFETLAPPAHAKINQDRVFWSWLSGTYDPTTGGSMQDALNAARKRNDARACAHIFTLYVQAGGGSKKPSATAELEPDGGGGGAEDPDKGKKIYTRQDVKDAFQDIQANRRRYTQKQRDAITEELILAGKEGRIRG